VNLGQSATKLQLQHELHSSEYTLKIQGTEGELKFTQRKVKPCNCNPGTREIIAYDLDLPSWLHVIGGIVTDKWADQGFIGLLKSFEKHLRVNSQAYDQDGIPPWEAEGIYQLSSNANERFDTNAKRKLIGEPNQDTKSCWEIQYNFMLSVNGQKNYLTKSEQ